MQQPLFFSLSKSRSFSSRFELVSNLNHENQELGIFHESSHRAEDQISLREMWRARLYQHALWPKNLVMSIKRSILYILYINDSHIFTPWLQIKCMNVEVILICVPKIIGDSLSLVVKCGDKVYTAVIKKPEDTLIILYPFPSSCVGFPGSGPELRPYHASPWDTPRNKGLPKGY